MACASVIEDQASHTGYKVKESVTGAFYCLGLCKLVNIIIMRLRECLTLINYFIPNFT